MTNRAISFVKAQSAGQLLRMLYKDNKNVNRKFSLQFICNKAGLPSKGYLGDVFSGRRHLNPKYNFGVMNVFAMKGLERKLFQLLVQLENEKSNSKLDVLHSRLGSIRNQIENGWSEIPSGNISRLLVSRIYCSLGVFTHAPTRQLIFDYFAACPYADVEAALDSMIEQGFIKDADGKLEYTAREVVFESTSKIHSHIQYLDESIQYARQLIARQFEKRDQSYFESCVLSVDVRKFTAALPRIREFFDLIQSELVVDSGADDLAHFNIQIFLENPSEN